MGRGYWLPPQSENLAACDGFYIDSSAVYGNDQNAGWTEFLEKFSRRMIVKERTLRKIQRWHSYGAGQGRFIVLRNRSFDIIAEDVDDYIAVYVIIPEDCPTPGHALRSFKRYVEITQEVLTELYPGSIRKRVNSQKTKAVG